MLDVKILPLLDRAIFHQHPVIHLIMLTEILLVVALEHIAVIPVLAVQVHRYRNAPLQSHRPVRDQIADDGVGKLAFQHNGVGQNPIVEHRVKHRAAAEFLPGNQGKALVPTLPTGSALNADAHILVHHVAGFPQELGNNPRLPLDPIIGKGFFSHAAAQVPLVVGLAGDVNAVLAEYVLILEDQAQGIAPLRGLETYKIGLGQNLAFAAPVADVHRPNHRTLVHRLLGRREILPVPDHVPEAVVHIGLVGAVGNGDAALIPLGIFGGRAAVGGVVDLTVGRGGQLQGKVRFIVAARHGSLGHRGSGPGFQPLKDRVAQCQRRAGNDDDPFSAPPAQKPPPVGYPAFQV